jgi:hypothetical protein
MQLQIQLHGDQCPTNQAYYTGIVNAFQTIIKEEGPAALYKVRKNIITSFLTVIGFTLSRANIFVLTQ